MRSYIKKTMKKRILILGNAQSIWVKEYIEYVLLPTNKYDIYVSSQNKGGDFSRFYSNNGINIVETDKAVLGIKNSRLKTVINLYSHIKKIGAFDIIHVHYVPTNIMSWFYAKCLFKFGNRICLSFWGSDLLEHSSVNRWQRKCVESCDYITLSGSILKDAFYSQYKQFNKEKIKIAKFGVAAFEYIDEIKRKYTKEQLKEQLGFDSEKILVSIGYNSRESQQHLNVVEQINKLPLKYKNKMSIVIQFGTGGASDEYKEKVKSALEEAGIEYKLTEGFLDKRQTAVLRAGTDIFIHAQKTDALSASVQEYLYSGAYVINPVWIDYKDLKEIGVEYKEYNSFDELGEIIKTSIDCNLLNTFANNQKALRELSGWSFQRKNWLEIYK